MRVAPLRMVAALVVLGSTLAGLLTTTSLGQPQGELRRFMRQKLEHSQRGLEGLAREDYVLIGQSARAMRELSEDAQWRISPDADYVRLSRAFQGLADELALNAKEKDLDGATLAYVKLTLNCVECHKLIRSERLIGADPGGSDRRP